MEQQPTSCVTAIEALAADTLREASPGVMMVERYVKEELPMGDGREKSLGFATLRMLCASDLAPPSDFDRTVSSRPKLGRCLEPTAPTPGWRAPHRLQQ